MLQGNSISKLSLALLAATCLMPLAAAQEHELDLSFTPSTGIQGVYAFVEADTRLELRLGAIKQNALVFVAIQAANIKGDIDLKTASHLVPVSKWYAGDDFGLEFEIPGDFADRIYSVQAVAQLDHKTFLTSPVVSLIVRAKQERSKERDPMDPDIAGENSGSDEQAASGPGDAERKTETQSDLQPKGQGGRNQKKDDTPADVLAEQSKSQSLKGAGPVEGKAKQKMKPGSSSDRAENSNKDAMDKKRRAARDADLG